MILREPIAGQVFNQLASRCLDLLPREPSPLQRHDAPPDRNEGGLVGEKRFGAYQIAPYLVSDLAQRFA
jgi:hypothetical protein